jgi:DNA-binding CsgD family transcriptional regulator
MDEVESVCVKRKIDLVIINPSMIQMNTKAFNSIKYHFAGIFWVGLVYAYFNQEILSMFDSLVTISDSSEMIKSTIIRLVSSDVQRDHSPMPDVLSERETEVLKLLATGMSNKEIADKLNISTNTVITHRKRVTQKTGIKSVSGLTIYAVVQKLISIEALKD